MGSGLCPVSDPSEDFAEKSVRLKRLMRHKGCFSLLRGTRQAGAGLDGDPAKPVLAEFSSNWPIFIARLASAYSPLFYQMTSCLFRPLAAVDPRLNQTSWQR